MTLSPFKISDPNAGNSDGEIDNDGLVDIHSGLGYRLATREREYFDHSRLWDVNGENIRGSWYRFFSGPWNKHNHGSIHRNHETGYWLHRNIISRAGPRVGGEQLSTWRGNSEPFSRVRPTVLVLMHGATNSPATHPEEHIGQLRHARTYWGFDFVSGLLGNTARQLYSLSGTALNATNWETTAVTDNNVGHHIITSGLARAGQVPQLSVMLTHRDGSQKLAEQGQAAIRQISKLYQDAFGNKRTPPQIVLVGHSMGGLVARYIACNPANAVNGVTLPAPDRATADTLRRLTMYMITLAAPHEGSPQADKWTEVYDSLHNNVPDWFNQIYAGLGLDGFPYSISYMGGNRDCTRDLRKSFWQEQNRGQLAPHRAIRPENRQPVGGGSRRRRSGGQLIPIYALIGRTPGGQYFDNPNEPLGGITPPTNRDEFEALGLVIFDKALHELPGGPSGWGTIPAGSADLDWVKRTTIAELADGPLAALTTILELSGLNLTPALIQAYAENMPFYLDKPWQMLTAQEMAGALKDQGAEFVAGVLKDFYDLLSESTAQILKALGYTVETMTEAMKDVYNLGAETMAGLLKNLSYQAGTIAQMMKDVYGQGAKATAEILQDIGFGAGTIAKTMQDVFSQGASATAEILKNLGFDANTIAKTMQDVFGQGALATAKILKGLGYGITTITKAIVDTFNASMETTVDVLANLGFSPQDIASAIKDVFNVSTASAAAVITSVLGIHIN